VSNYTTTLTATSRTRSESAFVLLGTGNGSANPAFQAQWAAHRSHVQGMHVLGKTSVDMRVNPIFFRDRVNAAKQGSPPRGVPR
jgi:hypothetical protein